MRKLDSKNQIWYTEQEGGYQIGFTKSFLEGLDQCWYIMPAHAERFKLKSPLLTIETNEMIFSILSPVTGFFQQMENKAQNFPDKLTENDIVLHLTKVAQRAAPEPMRWDAHAVIAQQRVNMDVWPAGVRAGDVRNGPLEAARAVLRQRGEARAIDDRLRPVPPRMPIPVEPPQMFQMDWEEE